MVSVADSTIITWHLAEKKKEKKNILRDHPALIEVLGSMLRPIYSRQFYHKSKCTH